MKKHFTLSLMVFTFFTIIPLITSCNNKASFVQNSSVNMPMPAAVSKLATRANARSVDFEMAEAIAEDSLTERKLIKTGNVSLEVSSISDADQIVMDYAKSFGGYVTNTSSYEFSYNATVKVPCDRFEQAMTTAGNLGKIKYCGMNSQDVTDEYYDLETRLNTKKMMQKKMESYLSQAKNLSDLLEIERQLNNVTSEVESMEGRMKRLSNQIDFATIEINMNLPTGFTEQGFQWPDMGEKFRNFGSNFVNFIASLFMGIFYFILFGIPLVALSALLFWLLFGRVGLLRKLFSKLRKK